MKLLKTTILFICILFIFNLTAGKIQPIFLNDVDNIEASHIFQDNRAQNVMDNDMKTRWESDHNVDPVWLEITLKEPKFITSLQISWEKAAAKVYNIQLSMDKDRWQTVAEISNGTEGEERLIEFDPVEAKYIRLQGQERVTQWGYSIWEIKINPGTLDVSELPYMNQDLSIKEKIDDLISRMTLPEKIDEICGKDFMDGKTNQRLKIPPLLMTDGPHGIRDMYGVATCFPTLLMLGSTWDIGLMQKMGVALGQEARAKGRNLILGPCIGIHRTPLGGRNFESYSEDPYLVGRMATAYVKGVQSQMISTSTKHYVANNQEWERNNISVEISERALREIYLPGFKAAVTEGKTYTIMGAYNMVNGDYCCENSHILIDILKNEWGFKGFVVSDWWAIHDGIKAANNGCDMEMPGSGSFFTREKMLDAVKTNKVKESTIDDKVRRILYVKYKLGLFHGEADKFKGAANTKEHQELARKIAEGGIVLLKNNKNLLPLQKEKIKSIAVIGPNSTPGRAGGGGSSQVGPPYIISPLEGVKNKFGDKIKITYAKGCNMPNELTPIPKTALRPDDDSDEYGLKGEYFNNIDFSGEPTVVRIDKNIDFNWGGDAPDNKLNNDNYSVRWTGKLLPPTTGNYELSIVSDDGSKLYINNKLIVDNWGDHGPQNRSGKIKLTQGKQYNIRIEFYEKIGGAVMKLGWNTPNNDLKNEAISAAKNADATIVFAGLNNMIEGEGVDRSDMKLPKGQDELIKSVVNVNKNTIVVLINGTPVNMQQWIDDVPAVLEAWYPGQEGGNAIANIISGEVNPSGKLSVTLPKRLEDNPSYANYPGANGKVYYKEGIFVGYRHYDQNEVEPAFPFGHGLSYSDFKYSDMIVEPVKSNDGKTAVSVNVKNISDRLGTEVVQLYINDEKSSVPRPPKELKRFKKITLKPGEMKTVDFKIDMEALSFFHPDRKEWTAEPGKFNIMIGSSSRDIRVQNSFTLSQ